jgi:anti-sigma regulatory factor (Ser/Thr protein kinase)/uncharacterized protein (DUF1330 family)
MVGVRKRGEQVRKFILDNVEQHPRDIVYLTAGRFDIGRSAVRKHLKRLVDQEAIVVEGATKDRVYKLHPSAPWQRTFALERLQEDRVWADGVGPQLARLPDNVRRIWAHGVTEMVNNAIDHSEGTEVTVIVERLPTHTVVSVIDDGVGIFRKIQAALDLPDSKLALLELSKGKFTTDPKRHSGEGIFFTSRMFDLFAILSYEDVFACNAGEGISVFLPFTPLPDTSLEGTKIMMRLDNNTSRTTKQIFAEYTTSEDDDDYSFSRTSIPVQLAKFGDEFLVSRSQARRVLDRVDRFKTVVLDFEGVESIGQAFSDEIFRVFARNHPEVAMLPQNANQDVWRMILRARAAD